MMLQLLSISQSGIKTAKEAERERRETKSERAEREKARGGDGGIFNQLAYHAHLGRPLSLHLNLCLCKSKLLPMAHFACVPLPPHFSLFSQSSLLCWQLVEYIFDQRFSSASASASTLAIIICISISISIVLIPFCLG